MRTVRLPIFLLTGLFRIKQPSSINWPDSIRSAGSPQIILANIYSCFGAECMNGNETCGGNPGVGLSISALSSLFFDALMLLIVKKPLLFSHQFTTSLSGFIFHTPEEEKCILFYMIHPEGRRQLLFLSFHGSLFPAPYMPLIQL